MLKRKRIPLSEITDMRETMRKMVCSIAEVEECSEEEDTVSNYSKKASLKNGAVHKPVIKNKPGFLKNYT